MRIWAFPAIYPYDYPGAKWHGIFAHRQYQGLINSGADLKVIVPIPWNPPAPFSMLHKEWKKYAEMNYPKERVYDGITVYHPRISNKKPSRLERKSFLERYVDTVIKFFKDNNIQLDPKNDIFYSQWIPDAALAQIAAHRLGVKSAILSIGDDVVVYPYQCQRDEDLFSKAILEADVNLTVADYLGKETRQIVKKEIPYHIIHMGANHKTFKPGAPEERKAIREQYNMPQDKVIILNAGSAIVRKGWLDLLNAAQEIKKTNDNFAIAAVYGAPFDLNIPEEAAKRGLTDNLVNIGEVVPEKLNLLYKAADIFCLPSHWEGIAVVCMESMASGMPIITTNVCGHPELVNDGVTGMLIPPKRVDLLTDRLRTLIADPRLRATLGHNARNFMVNEWGSYDEIAVKLYKILQDALKS